MAGRSLPFLFALLLGVAAVLPAQASTCPRAVDVGAPVAVIAAGLTGSLPALACASASGTSAHALVRTEVSPRAQTLPAAPLVGTGVRPPAALYAGPMTRPRPPTAGMGEALRTVVLRV